MHAMPTRDQILEALKVVIDPELRRDIVELEMVRSIEIKDGGIVDVTVSLTTPGCPIKNHFETAVDGRRARRRRRHARQRRLRRPHRPGEGRPAAQARPPRRAARGRARAGLRRPLHRLGQGRRRQVVADRQPRRRAGRRGQEGRRARRRRLGLLDPAHARPRRRAAEGLGRAQDPAARGARPEGHVDRLLPRRGRGGRVARPDAPQGAHAVPRGRRVGRARPPADRPAARHRRRLDDARRRCCRRRSSSSSPRRSRPRRRSRAAPRRWPTRSSSRSPA